MGSIGEIWVGNSGCHTCWRELEGLSRAGDGRHVALARYESGADYERREKGGDRHPPKAQWFGEKEMERSGRPLNRQGGRWKSKEFRKNFM
jgi:hypothetical protein